jgi:hypothetical protein
MADLGKRQNLGDLGQIGMVRVNLTSAERLDLVCIARTLSLPLAMQTNLQTNCSERIHKPEKTLGQISLKIVYLRANQLANQLQ